MTSITAQTHATLDGVIDAPPADALLPYMSDESFGVTETMRDTLYARLEREGVPLARDSYDAAAPYVAE